MRQGWVQKDKLNLAFTAYISGICGKAVIYSMAILDAVCSILVKCLALDSISKVN